MVAFASAMLGTLAVPQTSHLAAQDARGIPPGARGAAPEAPVVPPLQVRAAAPEAPIVPPPQVRAAAPDARGLPPWQLPGLVPGAKSLSPGPARGRAALTWSTGNRGPDAITSWLLELAQPSIAAQLLGTGQPHEEGRLAGHGQRIELRPAPQVLELWRRRLVQEQAPYVSAVQAAGGQVIDSYQVVVNGLLVHGSQALATKLAELDGVARMWPVVPVAPLLAESMPLIGADRVTQELDLDGENVVVAIADCGIDYYHAAFGGSGRLRDYDPDDENVVEPGTFPTARVVGGYDFAGQRYSPNCASLPFRLPDCHTEPSPDPDPLEPRELNHGTPVASILAGQATERVPAGVAPAAKLVALKIMGNPIGAPPATDLLPSALEWVVAHNLGLAVPGIAPPLAIDVLNLSVGYPWAGGLPPIERAIDAAVATGITVIGANGDGGDVPFIAGQPAAASQVLAVGASVPPGRAEQVFGIRAEWPAGDETRRLTAPALEADFTPTLRQTGPITLPLAYYGLACSDAEGRPEPPAQDVAGRVALIARGTCSFYDKLWNAAKAGARAAIVFSDDRDPVVMSCQAPSDCSHAPPLPAVMIQRRPGVTLADLLAVQTPVTVGMAADLLVDEENLTDIAASYSSRGPARSGALKPQLVAPGAAIFAARAGGGTFGERRSGTSIAAPFVAGAAAVLRQRSQRERLHLEPLDIGALLANYADGVVRIGNADTGPAAPPALAGAGRLNVWRSARGELLVRAEANEGISDLGLGLVHVGDSPLTLVRRLTVRNLTSRALAYRTDLALQYPGEDERRGVEWSAPAEVRLPPGGSVPLTVTVRLDPLALRPWALRGFGTPLDTAVVQRQEVDGSLMLRPLGDSAGEDRTVRVPFHVLPRPHACVVGEPQGSLLFLARGQARSETWRNLCPAPGSVEAFRILGLDGAEATTPDAARSDIDAVAVRYAPNPNREGDYLLEFAIRTRAPKRLPLEAELLVYLDIEADGAFDRVIFNRLGRRIIGLPEVANRWLVAQAPVISGTLTPDYDALSLDFFAQRFDLDETVTVLQTSARALGLDLESADATFAFGVVATDNSGDWPITGTEHGQDLAPDGLAEGARYTFRRRELDCLDLEGEAGQAALTPVGGLNLEGGSSATVDIRLRCDATPPGEALGFLFSYPANWPAERQSEVRLWRPLGRGNPLYAPELRRNAGASLP